jgi:hypothetical protein
VTTVPPTAIPAMAPELRPSLPLVVLLLAGTFVAVIDTIEVPGANTVETLTEPGSVLVTVTAEGEVLRLEVVMVETTALTLEVFRAGAEGLKLEVARADTGT